MTREEAVQNLIIAKSRDGDPEAAHKMADEILCDFLESLGYDDIVKAWDNVKKWYA